MLNTSELDNNSTSNAFNINICSNGVYVGIIVAHVAMSLSFILGTPAHSWLLWLYLHTGWKIKPTQVFPLNMTILELIYSIQCGAELISGLLSNKGELWMVLIIVYTICWVGRPLMQVCVCIEQYLAVIHPVIFLKYKGLQYRIICTAVVWLIAALCAVYEACLDNFALLIFNYIFAISLIIISFCCVSVLRTLKQPGPGDTQIPMERGRDVGNQQKRNVFNTIFSGLLIILFSYLPQVLLSLVYVKQIDKKLFYCNIVAMLGTFNILGMMVRPFLKMCKNVDVKCLKHQKKITLNPGVDTSCVNHQPTGVNS